MTSKTLLSIISGVLLVSCNSEPESSAHDTNQSQTIINDTALVSVTFVKKGLFVNETWCNGTLQAGRKAIVPFELQGNLVKVKVSNGQKVTQGQILAQLDDYRQQQELKQAILNYEQAQLDFEDQLLLSGYKPADTLKIPATVMRMAKIRSGLSATELSLAKAKREQQNTLIIAPVAGVVSGLKAQAFTPTSEYKNLCTLINPFTMAATFQLLESDAALIKPGLRVKVLPIALPGKVFDGEISEIDPVIDANGLLQVTAKVNNPSGILLDGMKVKVVVNTHVPDQLTVPKSAVLARQNRQVVFTVEDGLAVWNYVTTGLENSTQFTITEGLEAGQMIITGNNLTIGHNAPVKVKR
ncbi:MAG: efflux RND transporter periplasmic adaptor subunit [Lentimicrobiaceae bacterium]